MFHRVGPARKYPTALQLTFFQRQSICSHTYAITAAQGDMVSLNTLPVELLEEITSLVCEINPLVSRILTLDEAKALCVLRSVCHRVNCVAESFLFHHLVIIMNFSVLESPRCTARLQSLAEGSTSASVHAKALTIRIDGGAFDNEGGHGSIMPDPKMGQLALALSSLCNVNSVM
jgi:hypothetical protein